MVELLAREHQLVVPLVAYRDSPVRCVDREHRVLVQLVYVLCRRFLHIIVPRSVSVRVPVIRRRFAPVPQRHRFHRLRVVYPPSIPVAIVRVLIVRIIYMRYLYRHLPVAYRRVRPRIRQVARIRVYRPRSRSSYVLAVVRPVPLQPRRVYIYHAEERMRRIARVVVRRPVFRIPVPRLVPRFQYHTVVLLRVRVPLLYKPRYIKCIEVVLPLRRRQALHPFQRHRLRAVRIEAVPCYRVCVPRLDYPVYVDLLAVGFARVVPAHVHRRFYHHVPCFQLRQSRDLDQATVVRRPSYLQPVPSVKVCVPLVVAYICILYRSPEHRLDVRINRYRIRTLPACQPFRVRLDSVRKRAGRFPALCPFAFITDLF